VIADGFIPIVLQFDAGAPEADLMERLAERTLRFASSKYRCDSPSVQIDSQIGGR
jgi:hypothetical protein